MNKISREERGTGQFQCLRRLEIQESKKDSPVVIFPNYTGTHKRFRKIKQKI